jgi:hypothetical protein
MPGDVLAGAVFGVVHVVVFDVHAPAWAPTPTTPGHGRAGAALQPAQNRRAWRARSGEVGQLCKWRQATRGRQR